MRGKLKDNTISTADLVISAEGLISEKAALRDVRISYVQDEEGRRTNVIDCVRYDCFCVEDLSTFVIKVAGGKAVITREALEKSKEPVFIQIPVGELTIKPYEIQYGVAKVTITAPYVKLIEN